MRTSFALLVVVLCVFVASGECSTCAWYNIVCKLVGSSSSTNSNSNSNTKSKSNSASSTTTAGIVYSATTTLNIRSGPGTSYSIVGTLSPGEKITVTSISNGWAKHSKGYSSTSYLTKVASNNNNNNGGSTGSTSLTISQLTAIYNNLSASKASTYLPYLNAAMKEASINTPLRVAHFMAQLGTESAGLVYWEEIADGSAYEGRTDLGNTQPGDGMRYKGRGPIQITGRSNYKACGTALGLDLINNPTLLIQPQYGFRSAGWYWDSRNINALADADDILACTRAVNGGTNGFDSRKAYLAKAKKALGI